MNWEAIGAIAELTAAIGVVISLIYLAVQIRTNTQEVVGSRTHSIYEMIINHRADLTTGDLASIFAKLAAGEELTMEEHQRVHNDIERALNIYEVFHLHARKGRIDDEMIHALEARLNAMISSFKIFGYRSYWEDHKHFYSKPFATYVDEQFGKDDV